MIKLPQPVLPTRRAHLFWTPKLWGRTRLVLGTPHFELHEAQFRAGGFTSIHYHANRNQLVYVQSGVLGLSVHDATGKLVQQFSIPPGGVFTCSAGCRHQLTGETDCVVLEQYLPTPAGFVLGMEDIIRLSEGGQG